MDFVIVRTAATTPAELVARLSKSQLLVLEHFMAGNSAKWIARELGISEQTIRNHRANAMKKLQAHSREEMARIYLLGVGRKSASMVE